MTAVRPLLPLGSFGPLAPHQLAWINVPIHQEKRPRPLSLYKLAGERASPLKPQPCEPYACIPGSRYVTPKNVKITTANPRIANQAARRPRHPRVIRICKYPA